MSKIDNILKQLNNDQFLCRLKSEKVRFDLRNKILSCHHKRVFNKYSRLDVSKSIGYSEATIKRLEKGEVYDICTIYNYINLLKDLPNKKKRQLPKWVHQ